MHIESKATFYNNEVDSSCLMLSGYCKGVEAYLTSTFLENSPTEAIFHCERGIIKINSRFHGPSDVTLISKEKEETIEFNCDTHGYSFEILHFSALLRNNKKESDVITFDFSRKPITLLDAVRLQKGLNY